MEQKLNPTILAAYGDALAHKIVTSFFESNDVITGQDILELTDQPQINTFILAKLFSSWNEEAEKLKSPYFNYEAEEVQKALVDFRNVLSYNIEISKDDFLSLVIFAVERTFDFVLHPHTFITTYYLDYPEIKVSVDRIKKDTKYLKINRFLIDGPMSSFSTEVSDEIIFDDFMDRFNEAYQQKQDELVTMEQLLEELNQIHPVPYDKIFTLESGESLLDDLPKVSEEEIPAEVEEEAPEAEDTNEEAEQVQDGEVDTLEEVAETETHSDEMKAAAESPEQEEQEAPTDLELKATLNDRHAQERVTLNDKHAVPETTALRVSKKVGKLADAIAINQRYAFINKLFDGNKADYDHALEEVENFDDYEGASNFLIDHYANMYHWDKKELEVEELLQLLARKF